MGAPESGMQAGEQPTAETLLTSLRTIKAGERAKHESVVNYWLSIRGSKEFPPLHDLDPLEISDAGPSSILLELIGGGQDAEIRHLGEDLQGDIAVQKIIDSPNPSILSSIAKKLPIVAISRDILAFEDSFTGTDGPTRCWVTLLPLSSCGSWVDYVYAFVSVESSTGKVAKAPDAEPVAEVSAELEEPEAEVAEAVEVVPADEPEVTEEVIPFVAEAHEEGPAEAIEPAAAIVAEAESEPEPEVPADEPASKGPGFSKLLDGVANLAGFYGQGIKADPVVDIEMPMTAEPEAAEEAPVQADKVEPLELDEPVPAVDATVIEDPIEKAASHAEPESTPAMEGTLQSKLSEVRAKAEESQEALQRAIAALHEGLSAAYDFALDAEGSPEEYLRLVEAEGLKIQLRAPMAPVAKLAFKDHCDPATIADCETVLAWALKQELPRGTLLERIEQAGGIAELLSEVSRPN